MATSAGSTEKPGIESRLAAACALVNDALGHVGDEQKRLKEILTELSKVLQSETELAGGQAGIFNPAPRGEETIKLSASTIESSVLTSEPVKKALHRAGQFKFNALKFCATPEVRHACIAILGRHLIRNCSSDMLATMKENQRFADIGQFDKALGRFFEKIDRRYNPKAVYHGSSHACDVMSTMSWFLNAKFFNAGGGFKLLDTERFMGLVAAAIHDVGHMGRNNNFYTKTMDPLAITYNDESVLENMHISTSFEIMREDEGCNWFKLLATESQGDMRKGLISMVLATDPAKAMPRRDSSKQVLLDIKDEGEKVVRDDSNKKLLLLGTILHAADVSNPTKPQHIMVGWVGRLLQEFWEQGDEERRFGVPISMMCDREAEIVKVPSGQLGFINFVIKPLYSIIVSAIEETQEALDQLSSNATFWQGKETEKATYEQIFDNSDELREDSCSPEDALTKA